MHTARSNRRSNDARRARKQRACQYVPEETRLATAAERAAAKLARYPDPPRYRYEMKGDHPKQPACYQRVMW